MTRLAHRHHAPWSANVPAYDPLHGYDEDMRRALEAANLGLLIEVGNTFVCMTQMLGPRFRHATIKTLVTRDALAWHMPGSAAAITHQGRKLANLSARRRALRKKFVKSSSGRAGPERDENTHRRAPQHAGAVGARQSDCANQEKEQ